MNAKTILKETIAKNAWLEVTEMPQQQAAILATVTAMGTIKLDSVTQKQEK